MLPKLLSTVRFALLGTVGLLAAASLAQTTIHVGPGQTYTTIQSGINAANNGDTVLVAPGTYTENINFNGKAIAVISAQGAANTIIQGDGTAAVVTFDHSEARNSVLNGFTIQGVSNPAPGQYNSGVLVSSAPTILNNIITNNPCNGIDVNFGGPLIQGNVITNSNALGQNAPCASFTGSGIVLGGYYSPASVVIGNTIIHNQHAVDYNGGGILMWASENSVIENNVIAENATPTGEGGGIATYNSDAMIIAQNLFYANVAEYGGGAIALHPPSESQGPFIGLIQNNTFVGNTSVSSTDEFSEPGASQVYLDGNLGQYEFIDNIVVGADSNAALVCGTIYNYLSATPLVIDHNDIYNSVGPAYGGACPDQTGQYGNISVDPRFKNAAGNDYHLLAGSPAIDTGNNSALQLLANLGYALTGDFEGNPRVQDASGKGYPVIDMGVYEHSGATTASPTTAVLNPSSYNVGGGQTFTLTANLYSPLGLPTGTVTFFEDGTQIGTATIDNTSAATLTLGNGLIPGTHAFLAAYAGQGSFTPCESVKIYVIVNAYGVTLTLNSAPNPSQLGQNVTFTSKISAENGVPAGNITLTDNSTNTTLATLTPDANGNSSFSTAALAVGTHSIQAAYPGNTTYTSASATVEQIVEAGNATSTVLISSLNPSSFGRSVTLTATVSLLGGGASPTGSITFLDGTTSLATINLQNGTAQYSTSSLTIGSHTITASYQPTGNFGASSASLIQVVNNDPTTTAVTCQPNSINIGNTSQLIATVTSAYGTPTGSIAFTDNGTALETQALLAGTTTVTYPGASAGTHNITATYAPSGSFAASAASCSEFVNALPTTSVLSVAPTSSTYGSPVTLTATVAPATPPGPGTPTGTVTFYNGSSAIGSSTLASGVASVALSSLPAGTYSPTCVYSGSTVYATSNCNPVSVSVKAAATSLTLSSNLNPAPALSPVSFAARLTVNGQSAGAGNAIRIVLDGQTINLTTDATGTASYTISTLTPNTYPVTASFAATNNLLPSSSALTEVITTAPTSINLIGSPNPGYLGQPVTLAATVSSQATSTSVNSGSVTFYDGTSSLGSAQVAANGTASLTASFSTLGTHDLTAVYSASTDFSGSTSTVFNETITLGDFSISVQPAAASVYTGQAAALKISVTSLQGFNQQLALACTGLPANTTCSFSPASIAGGQGTAVLTISTAAPHQTTSTAEFKSPLQHRPGRTSQRAMPAIFIAGIALLVLPRKFRIRNSILGLLAVFILLGVTSCGAPAPITGGTPPGSYKIAVTAEYSVPGFQLEHSAPISLTVKSLF